MAGNRQNTAKLLSMPGKACYDAAAEKEKNVIGRKIAQARRAQGLSLAALSRRLADYGLTIQRQGISHWETGEAVPNAYQLLAVCHALHMEDGLAFFSESEAPELNELGRKKLLDYKQDLIASGRYAPQPPTETEEIRYTEMPVSMLKVSAGTGAFLEEDSFERLRFPEAEVPAGADFGVRISGDSMEPVYQDGQIAWVRQCRSLRPGETGVFMYNGEGYIKVYRERMPEEQDAFLDSQGVLRMQPVLVSYNQAYAPILISPELNFQIVGRVLN